MIYWAVQDQDHHPFPLHTLILPTRTSSAEMALPLPPPSTPQLNSIPSGGVWLALADYLNSFRTPSLVFVYLLSWPSFNTQFLFTFSF